MDDIIHFTHLIVTFKRCRMSVKQVSSSYRLRYRSYKQSYLGQTIFFPPSI